MENVTLLEAAEYMGAPKDLMAESVLLSGVSTDTRTLLPGEIFFAIIGPNFDGHKFLQLAVEKGAAAVVVSREVEELSVPILRVKDTQQALWDLAAHYRQKFKIPVVAVTGSSGKTTTKDMIACILRSHFRVLATEKNFNNHIGVPLSLLGLKSQHECAVIEMGMNHAGEIEALSQMARPDIAVITNVGTAHIEFLGSREGIFAAKMEIVSGLCESGTLVVNADDDMLARVARFAKGDKNSSVPFEKSFHNVEILSVSADEKSKSFLRAENIEILGHGVKFFAKIAEETEEIFLPVQGRHNVSNALLAIACGLRLGVTLAQAKEALSHYMPSSLRGEIFLERGVTIFKDYYNANLESMTAALNLLAESTTRGRKIAILGEILELGKFSAEIHEKLGKICKEKNFDAVFFIGESHKSFAQGCTSACQTFATKAELLSILREFVKNGGIKAGDAVLIKGSRGMRMEEVYEALRGFLGACGADGFVPLPKSAVRLSIDTSAIKHNLSEVRSKMPPGVDVMPVVKANAYGCGSNIAGNLFQNERLLAVADAKEAVIFHKNCPQSEILILYQPQFSDIRAIVEHSFSVAVCEREFLRKLSEEAARCGKTVNLHVEVDTGMGRLGIAPEEAEGFAREAKRLPGVKVQGIFMHYAAGDTGNADDMQFSAQQTTLFEQAIERFEKVYGEVPLKHACCGGPAILQSKGLFNMVRPGYMLYGYYPSDALRPLVTLRPALKLLTKILFVKTVPAKTPISYGRTFVTMRESRIATVAIGYSDGVSRRLSNCGFFVVNNQRAPIVGRVCMDLTMLDVTDIYGEVCPGDDVAIFDNVNVTVDELAGLSGTIGYELIAGIDSSAERVEQV